MHHIIRPFRLLEVQPYTWSITNGSLPNGLTLNSSTGNISGTPTAQGTSTFTIQDTDANSQTNSSQFSLTINNSSDGVGNTPPPSSSSDSSSGGGGCGFVKDGQMVKG